MGQQFTQIRKHASQRFRLVSWRYCGWAKKSADVFVKKIKSDYEILLNNDIVKN